MKQFEQCAPLTNDSHGYTLTREAIEKAMEELKNFDNPIERAIQEEFKRRLETGEAYENIWVHGG